MQPENTDPKHGTAAAPKDPSIDIYCRLFADIVPLHICVLRKKELNTFGWNTCSGCAVGLLQYWSKIDR